MSQQTKVQHHKKTSFAPGVVRQVVVEELDNRLLSVLVGFNDPTWYMGHGTKKAFVFLFVYSLFQREGRGSLLWKVVGGFKW